VLELAPPERGRHGVQRRDHRAHYGYGRCPARVHPAVYMTYAAGRYHTLRRRANALRARAARR
jgi:hypothetical protein